MRKLILTDVDGVLLDWNEGLYQWMKAKGYERKSEKHYDLGPLYGIDDDLANDLAIEFNHSKYVIDLSPLRDAVKYVKKLHEEQGFVLHCVTAIPNTQYIWNGRYKNLCDIFGTSAIGRLECTGTSENKRKILEEYKDDGIPWIEDRIENAEMGLEYGLDCYLIEHEFNKDEKLHEDLNKVKNWRELYDMFS